MLRDLHIENLALINDVWLEFEPGLTVLTGETGAGKTVLLSALELIMGVRANSDQISAGSNKARVEAAFELEDGELSISRTVNAGGRSRVLLDGELSSVGALQKRVATLIDLHGQHDHQVLLSSSRHGEYLDRWADENIGPLLQDYQEARELWQQAQKALTEIEDLLARSLEEQDAGRIALAEIEALDPQEGEDDELRKRLPALQNSERISELMQSAQASLRGEGASLEELHNLELALEQVEVFDPSLFDLRQATQEARRVLDGIADAVDAYTTEIVHEPRMLAETFDRLAALESLSKRYGPTLNAVLERKERLLSTLELVENSDEELRLAREAEASTRTTLVQSAKLLSVARKEAAKDFVAQLVLAASDLELGKVRFDISFEELPFEKWIKTGSEKIEILYAPAPAISLRPLAKIASGGEISRVMLALKSVLGEADSTGLLVFDEVDAGIGGATGFAIGAKLKSLSRTHQIIVVTHLAQVAAFADAHFKVNKKLTGDRAYTEVKPLCDKERIDEVARMLSGSDTEVARQHAEELLTQARDKSLQI